MAPFDAARARAAGLLLRYVLATAGRSALGRARCRCTFRTSNDSEFVRAVAAVTGPSRRSAGLLGETAQ